MGRAIVIALAVVLVLVGFMIVLLRLDATRRRERRLREGLALRGDLNRDQERQILLCLQEAETLLSGLGQVDGTRALDDVDILRDITRQRVAQWRAVHRKLMRSINQ